MLDVFVDKNNGSDETGVGTQEAPFATKEKAFEWFADEEIQIHERFESMRGPMWLPYDEPAVPAEASDE